MTAAFIISQLSVTLLTLIACHIVEAFRPVERRVARTVSFNLAYAAAVVGWTCLLQPPADRVRSVLAERLGAPIVPLPEHGYLIALSALVVMLAEDFLFYWGHRAQHRYGWLWAMHSFHHSDDDVNAGTAYRHYWLERPLWLAISSIPLALVFRISTEVAVLYGALFQFFSLFPHLNSRVELGKLSTVILGPQLHRIHHSRERTHFDTNFCGAFPVWDLFFRTYHAPRRGEFPATGVPDRPGVASIVATALWPSAAIWRDVTTQTPSPGQDVKAPAEHGSADDAGRVRAPHLDRK